MQNKNIENFTPPFYRYIDSPLRILFFEIDDLAIGIFTLFILLVLSLVFGFSASGIIYVYVVLSISASVYYAKFKKNKPNGYIFQFFYKKGLYHPTASLGLRRYRKFSQQYKISPQCFTKKMKGQ